MSILFRSSVTRCLVLLLLPSLLWAAKPPQAAIASAHPLATEAGFEILDQGGNAFDAAVAVAAVLSVVEPYSAGMGGGGFWLLHQAGSGSNVMVDAREMAPGAATRDMYLDAAGNVMREWSTIGPAAAAIPGQPAAFVHLAERYGSLPLEKTLAPAIRYAEEGFKVDDHYRRMATQARERLGRFPEARRVYLHQGDIPAVGYLLVQKELAQVLRLLAEKAATVSTMARWRRNWSRRCRPTAVSGRWRISSVTRSRSATRLSATSVARKSLLRHRPLPVGLSCCRR